MLLFDPKYAALTPRRNHGTVVAIKRTTQDQVREQLGAHADLVLGPKEESLPQRSADPYDLSADSLVGDVALFDGELVECRVTHPAFTPPP